MKGIDDGLRLVYEKDKNGRWLTPKEGGLLTDEEKKKVEALKHRKPVTVTIECLAQVLIANYLESFVNHRSDPSGNCGKDCKVCKMWNEKWAKDSVATKQLIEKEEKEQWTGLLDTVKPKVERSPVTGYKSQGGKKRK
jgi:hypothetical protein